MSQRPFRFLHAADLRLDQPVSAVLDAPDNLVDLLVDSPHKAAERVFDAAVSHHVDFVVLAGNVIDAQLAAPRDWLFLTEQFERLAQHNIGAYWAGGSSDSVSHWHDFVRWPGNVRYFPQGRIERHRYEAAGVGVCEIIGAGHGESGPPKAYEFSPRAAGVFSVAIVSADWNAAGLNEIGVNYWALGGAHCRSTPLDTSSIAHFPGTPQGRTAGESGSHGCTIVSVDEHSRIHLTPVDCDIVRWHSPRVSVSDASDSAALANALCQRAEQLLIDEPNVAHLLSWEVECSRALRAAIRRGELTSRLLDSLRTHFGHRSPPCWTVSIEAEMPMGIPRDWQEEDTIRGDFLRELRSLTADAQATIIGGICCEVERGWNVATPAELRQITSHAAWLGADLLSPQEAAS